MGTLPHSLTIEDFKDLILTSSWKLQKQPLDGLRVQQQLLAAGLTNLAATEDRLKEAGGQAVGELVAEESEVVVVQG